jgi:hypothetical protein
VGKLFLAAFLKPGHMLSKPSRFLKPGRFLSRLKRIAITTTKTDPTSGLRAEPEHQIGKIFITQVLSAELFGGCFSEKL